MSKFSRAGVLLVGVLRARWLAAARLARGLPAAHRVLDAPLGLALLAGDALDVDPQQHVRAVACPVGDLGGGHAGVEPGRDGGVAQVVRPAHKLGGGVGLAERFAARGVEYLQVGPFRDDAAARAGEDPPAGPGAELVQMIT